MTWGLFHCKTTLRKLSGSNSKAPNKFTFLCFLSIPSMLTGFSLVLLPRSISSFVYSYIVLQIGLFFNVYNSSSVLILVIARLFVISFAIVSHFTFLG